MNEDLRTVIETGNWEHYLTRPFTLFETSVWNRWYDSNEIEELFGVRLRKAFFVEYPKGMVRHYRDAQDLSRLRERLRRIASDARISEALLDQGLAANDDARGLLQANRRIELTEAVAFCVRQALVGTVFPLLAGEHLMATSDAGSAIGQKVTALRAESLYPQVFARLLIPSAQQFIAETMGIGNTDLLHYATLDELLGLVDRDTCERRAELSTEGKYFWYGSENDTEDVGFIEETFPLIEELEPGIFDQTQLNGAASSKGVARGKVRRIIPTNLAEVPSLETGEVLVAPSTNPTLLPIMRKAAAIVTDEGGALSHAAVLARELGIPCITNTRNATLVLQDGDIIEVDGDRGVIRLLKKRA